MFFCRRDLFPLRALLTGQDVQESTCTRRSIARELSTEIGVEAFQKGRTRRRTNAETNSTAA